MANEFKIKKGLIVNGSGGTILDILGSQGQLFSVTDDLIGDIFSVNDISGLPILTVNSDETVTMGSFGANALVVNGSNVGIGTATPSEKLHVNGNTILDGILAIGTTTPESSSILDITSTTQGFLPPRMTTSQKNLITSPVEGLVVYDTDLSVLSYYNGITWQKVSIETDIILTIELVEQQFIDFYAPKSLKINSTSVIVGTSPVITILVGDVPYVLESTIPQGSKITIQSDIITVINMIIEYV